MSALLKDALREIRRSFGRFLSLLLIISLGCGLFTGLRASREDMILTAAKYFRENGLTDLRLRSSVGVRSDEIAAVRAAENVRGAYAGYTKDLYYNYDDQSVVVKAFSLIESVPEDSVNYLNRPVLVEGRMPAAKNECVVERKMACPDTFEIGNSLTFTSPDDPIGEVLAYDTFEIVGIVNSPVFIGLERDASAVGDGTVNSNVFLPETAFLLDYYTDLYVSLEGVDGMDPFSEEYRAACEKLGKPAVKAFEQSLKKRYDKLITDANSRIASAESVLSASEEILSKDREELYALYEQAVYAAREINERLGDSESVLDKVAVSNADAKVKKLAELISDETGEVRQRYLDEAADARADLEAAKAELSAAPELRTLCQTRFDQNDYTSYKSDADKIYNVSKAFPLFFALVAALICVNAMTRIVEEQRSAIGIYKALGYSSGSILAKYLLYSSAAAVVGGLGGSAAGMKLIPSLVIKTYRVMYLIPGEVTPVQPKAAVAATAVSLAITSAAAVFTCFATLHAQPSEIMRPKPPKAGKRVLLEKIPVVWGKLGFVSKVTVRNLFRYKKRFAMSVIGVAGCTALIITGFGLRYSISSIIDMQYGEVFTYDAVTAFSPDVDDPEKVFEENEDITGHVCVVSKMVMAGVGEKRYQSTMIAAEGSLDGYFTLKDVDGGILEVGGGAIINEKLAKLCSLKKGDMLSFTDMDGSDYSFRIKGIIKNYALNFVILSADEYRAAGGSEPYGMAFFNVCDGVDKAALKSSLIADGRVLGTSFLSDQTSGLYSQVSSLDRIVMLLIISAALLSLSVLYNLSEINITERRRELATIKVLGFFDSETAAYITRENLISTVIGILFGCIIGRVLHLFVVMTIEVEVVMFNHSLVWWAYPLGAAVTAAFSGLISIILHFRLKKIDMVESLKSVE